MQNLDTNKAHGHDEINIGMIKICVNQFVNLWSVSLLKINTGSLLLE